MNNTAAAAQEPKAMGKDAANPETSLERSPQETAEWFQAVTEQAKAVRLAAKQFNEAVLAGQALGLSSQVQVNQSPVVNAASVHLVEAHTFLMLEQPKPKPQVVPTKPQSNELGKGVGKKKPN